MDIYFYVLQPFNHKTPFSKAGPTWVNIPCMYFRYPVEPNNRSQAKWSHEAGYQLIKGIVHPEMKIHLLSTHPYADGGVGEV